MPLALGGCLGTQVTPKASFPLTELKLGQAVNVPEQKRFQNFPKKKKAQHGTSSSPDLTPRCTQAPPWPTAAPARGPWLRSLRACLRTTRGDPLLPIRPIMNALLRVCLSAPTAFMRIVSCAMGQVLPPQTTGKLCAEEGVTKKMATGCLCACQLVCEHTTAVCGCGLRSRTAR